VKKHELGILLPDYVELPSGLLAPTDVAAQGVPMELPPGISASGPSTPTFVQRAKPAPIDALGSWIDEPQLGLSPTSFEELELMVQALPFEQGAWALSWILRRLHPIRRDAEAQMCLADEIYGQIPGVPARVRQAVAQEPGRLPFAEPLLIPLLRMLIESSDGSDASMAQVGRVLERCVLGIASALNSRSQHGEDATDLPAWLGFFMRKSHYIRGMATVNELVRPHELLRLMGEPLGDRAEAVRCDIESAMVKRYGLGAGEQFRLGMALAAQLNLWDEDSANAQTMRFSRHAFDELVRSIGLAEKHMYALDLIAGSRQYFADEFRRLDADRSLLMSLHLPFQQRPFLQLSDGSLILLSPRFLHDWLTDGFHYRSLDAVAGIPPNRSLSARYLSFAGHAFERYCVEIAKTSHVVGLGHSAVISGDVPYRTSRGESRTVDLLISLGTDLVLCEIEHHRPGMPVSVEGSVESATADVRAHLVGQIRRLASCIEVLRDSDGPKVEGFDMGQVRRIWPVVVSVETPPQQPPLWDFVDREVGPLLSTLGAEPLTILDAEDFEILCGAVESGRSLGSMLMRKCSPEYARLELKVWLTHDPLAPRKRRPERLESAFKDLLDVVAAGFQSHAA
jgi:hypothetical protein